MHETIDDGLGLSTRIDVGERTRDALIRIQIDRRCCVRKADVRTTVGVVTGDIREAESRIVLALGNPISAGRKRF
ncbi:MAG: hypothetical protein AAF629_15960, partial [Chloroflexota bacterium]